MEYLETRITKTNRKTMKEKPEIFDAESHQFDTIEEIEKYLKEEYPNLKGKPIYKIINNKSVQIGKKYSFWNQDISHMNSKYYQEDFVEILKIEENWIRLK